MSPDDHMLAFLGNLVKNNVDRKVNLNQISNIKGVMLQLMSDL